MKILLLYIAFLGCCTNPVTGQSFPDIKFSRLTEKNGLSNDGVTWVVQDDEGFIWAGTHDGLNRLDGYQVKKFYHHPQDNRSLINNDIVTVIPDREKKVGIITKEGPCYFDKFTNLFTILRNKQDNASGDSKTGERNDSGGPHSFLAVYHKLHEFEMQLKRHDMVIHFHGSDIKLVDFTPRYDYLYKDRKNNIWLFSNEWLLQLDSSMKEIESVYHKDGLGIISFYQDSEMNYWLGTFGEGLFRYYPGEHEPLKPVHLSSDRKIIYSIIDWKNENNNRWIVEGTNSGMVLFDPVTYRDKLFLPERENEFSIPGIEADHLFVDRQNILWIATNNGLGYVEPGKQLITSWKITQHGELTGVDPSQQGFFSSFFNDSTCYWSSNFVRPGLIQYNDQGQTKIFFENLCPSCSPTLKGYTDRAFGIYKQDANTYWFSTNAGLVKYTPTGKKLAFYQPADGDKETGFRTILPYNDSLLWIRTRNNAAYGIYVFNTNQKKFIRHYYYQNGCASCLPPDLMDMLITRNKHVYTTPANHFLYTYDSTHDHFVAVKQNGKDPVSFPATTFESLAEDTLGNIWIGTVNGLFLFDPLQKRIIKDYSNDKVLGGVEISALCFDDDGNLWMNSERGLYCLVSSTGQIYNFNSKDGLPGNSIPGFLARGKNGYLLAGAWGYVIRFKPSKLLHHRPQGQIHFSDASIMNSAASWTEGKDGGRSITLLPGQNSFSVDFAVLNFDDPSGNRYYYKLEGAGNEWKENGNGHLSFFGLAPGKYLLHVKGGNKYGELFKDEDLLSVNVKPFWWQTLLFRLFCAAAVGMLIFLLLRRRIQNIRRESAFKQKIAETEMMALRSQMNPHFIFNSLNGIENFILQNDKRQASEYLNKFASLIRIILSNSRKEGVAFADDMETLQLYIDLELLRFNHSFCYTNCVDPALVEFDYRVPPLLIQPFVENAIVHGFANSDRKDLQLKVTATLEDEYVIYTIEDNGVGRVKAAIYNRGKSKHVSLGLQITNERIQIFNEQHHAQNALNIEDLYSNGSAAGTRVTVKVKTI